MYTQLEEAKEISAMALPVRKRCKKERLWTFTLDEDNQNCRGKLRGRIQPADH